MAKKLFPSITVTECLVWQYNAPSPHSESQNSDSHILSLPLTLTTWELLGEKPGTCGSLYKRSCPRREVLTRWSFGKWERIRVHGTSGVMKLGSQYSQSKENRTWCWGAGGGCLLRTRLNSHLTSSAVSLVLCFLSLSVQEDHLESCLKHWLPGLTQFLT